MITKSGRFQVLIKQKDTCNRAIELYTDVAQSYENYRNVYTAMLEGYPSEVGNGGRMGEIQEQVMMGNMILTGLCSPESD